jgi:hypothetical protein
MNCRESVLCDQMRSMMDMVLRMLVRFNFKVTIVDMLVVSIFKCALKRLEALSFVKKLV